MNKSNVLAWCLLCALFAATVAWASAESNGRATKKVILETSGHGESLATFTEAALGVKGVKSVKPTLEEKQIAVEYNSDVASLYQIITAARMKGLTAKLVRVDPCCGFCATDKNSDAKSAEEKPGKAKGKMANC